VRRAKRKKKDSPRRCRPAVAGPAIVVVVGAVGPAIVVVGAVSPAIVVGPAIDVVAAGSRVVVVAAKSFRR
jgi:hypothetical protein